MKPDEAPPAEAAGGAGGWLSFRARITAALVSASLIPLLGYAAMVAIARSMGPDLPDSPVGRAVLFALVVGGLIAIFVALLLAAYLVKPLRDFASAVERVSDGDRRTLIEVPGEDELALLADRYNRLATALDRRDTELRRVRKAITRIDPGLGAGRIQAAIADAARGAFDMTSSEVFLGDPDSFPIAEDIPGEPRPVRAVFRLGFDEFGVLAGTIQPTRTWEPADQMLLELFVAEASFAVRNAELIERVGAQNQRLRDLDAAKDDFLRGISHNLQTPLTSISAAAVQLDDERPDPRLELIHEQAGRLSRMVRQLVTVSRLDSQSLKPRSEVVALGPRARRAWEALGQAGTTLTLEDHANGWLGVADPDQLDQVLWALLDNAVRYGQDTPITVRVTVDEPASRLKLTIADAGPGIAEADRNRLFGRYERVEATAGTSGSGLGLYVSRELCRAMAGDLVFEPAGPGPGAAFSVILPGEPPEPAGDQ